MSYLPDPSAYVMIRTSKSHFYQSGSGQRLPKLYRLGDAKRFLTDNAKFYDRERGDNWEIVPVTLVFGEPLKQE